MNTVKRVSSRTFDDEVLASSIPVLIDFYADWCGPCRMLAPPLERAAGEFADRVKVVKVNVDEEPELAEQFRVESIPTLVFVHGGEIIGRASGLVSEISLRKTLQQLIDSATIA
jgi:thioredoxin 1